MAPLSPDMSHLDVRLNSFAAIVKPKTRAKPEFPHSPATHPHLSAQALAEAGFYHTPGSSSSSLDTVRCFLCACELGGWEETDDPFEEHVKRKGCAWADIVCQGKLDVSRGRLRDDYDEPEELPGSKESAKVRERTYEGWPHGRKAGWLPTPKNLSKAGFVFFPSSDAADCCLCPLCDLSMDGWEATDDPRAVHLRKSPDCRFFTATLRGQVAESSTKALQKSQVGRGRQTRAQTVGSEVPESVVEPEEQEHAVAEVDKPKRQRKPRGTTVVKAKAAGRSTRKKAAPAEDEPEEPDEPDGEAQSQAEDEVVNDTQQTEAASQSSKTRRARPPKSQTEDDSLGANKSQRSTQSKSSRSKKEAPPAVEAVTASEAEEEVPEPEDEEAEEPLEETPKASKSSRATSRPSKPSSRSAGPPPAPSEEAPVVLAPLSQLQRFANVPPLSPVPDQVPDSSRPIKPLKGSKSSRKIANIPRESLNKSLHQGALAARGVVEVIAASPPIPVPESRAKEAEQLDLPLGDDENKMTVEQLVRSEMKKRYDLMEREGEEMIRKWEMATMDARRKIEGL